MRDLQGHPIAGSSWEGFVVEQVLSHLPADAHVGFYRTAAGAEIDLVIEQRSRRVGIEIKFAAAPKPAKGFWQAADDLRLDKAFVMAPVERPFALAAGVEVVPVSRAGALLGVD